VSAVELHFRNFVVALDTSSLLKARGNVGVDFSEYGNLALKNLLVGANLRLLSDIVDEARLCRVIEDLLPQSSWCIEVFRSDLGEESDGLSHEVTMCLVEVDSTLAELDWLNRAQVVGTGALVVESHLSVSLEVTSLEASARSIDWELLVVDTKAVTMGVGIGEET
jgi:hypothetical protein